MSQILIFLRFFSKKRDESHCPWRILHDIKHTHDNFHSLTTSFQSQFTHSIKETNPSIQTAFFRFFFFEIKIIEINFSTFILLKKQITRPDFLHLNFTHIPFTNYNRWRYVFCLAFAPCSTSLANVTNSALVFCSVFPPIFFVPLAILFRN